MMEWKIDLMLLLLINSGSALVKGVDILYKKAMTQQYKL